MSSNITAGESRKPVRCLVIQLSRLGDTLQSLMALRAAKQLYPELEIHFVARERFAAGARRIPWIESVTTLSTDEILAPVLEGKKRQAEALRDLAAWVAPLVRGDWDFVVNWSYSESSSYLTGLIPAKVKLGYSRRKDTSFSALDGWSHYIQAVVQSEVEQNIHLTDVLTTQLLTALQIHAGDPRDNGDAPVTSKNFFAIRGSDARLGILGDDYTKRWLGVQLGAGQDTKAWRPESWAELLGLVLDNHPDYRVVLLGGAEDVERARRLQDLLAREGHAPSDILSLVGQTDFDLWASVVGRCSWLMSGDTAVIHLASVLGTRVFNISVGPVRWAETGPYGNGHYVIAPARACAACASRSQTEEHSCQKDVSPEAAYAAWSYAMGDNIHRRESSLDHHFRILGYTDKATSVRVLRSRIRNPQDGGGVHYEPLLSRPMEIDEWASMVMGHIARAWYCGWTPAVGQELARDRIHPALIQKLREVEESCAVLSKICEEATKTAVLLKLKSSNLKSERIMRLNDRQELAELGRKLQELDALIERMGKTSPVLRPFSNMAKVLFHNLNGTRLAELGKESAESYKQLFEGVAIVKQWVRHTLDLARPVAVGPNVVSLRDRRREVTV